MAARPPASAAALAAAQLGPVHVQGIPLRAQLPRSGTRHELPVLFEIDVARPEDERRPPAELCLLVDVSGSMGGQKIAAAKKAIVNIIDSLEEHDLLHLIAYNQTAKVVFRDGRSARAAELKELTASVEAGGLTNIEAAMNLARDVLSDSEAQAGTQRVFLLSDGRANEGVQDFEGLRRLARESRERGITVSAFGIGADFDERLMKAFAAAGRGSYSFLREAIVRSAIERSMAALQRTIGTEAAVHIESTEPGRVEHVYRPLEVHSDADDDDDDGDDDDDDAVGSDDAAAAEGRSAPTSVLRVGDLCAGGHKQLLVETSVQVPPGAQNGDVLRVIRYTLKYRSALSEVRSVQGEVTVTVGGATEVAPQVRIASTLHRLEPTILAAVQATRIGQAEVGLDSLRLCIAQLEEVQADDERGYVSAQIRRLGRIVEGVEQGTISGDRAHMMAGEMFERQNSGNLEGVLSPMASPVFRPGSPPGHLPPPAQLHLPPHGLVFGSPPFQPGAFPADFADFVVSPTYRPGAFFPESPPDSPAAEVESPLTAPAALLSLSRETAATLPSEWRCPITTDVMTDPVVASDGHTYERSAIMRWFADGNTTSPMHGTPLPDLRLIRNLAIRSQIMTRNDELARVS